MLQRGVAQLVARLLWEQDAAGSNPVTPTTSVTLDPLSPLVSSKGDFLCPQAANLFGNDVTKSIMVLIRSHCAFFEISIII